LRFSPREAAAPLSDAAAAAAHEMTAAAQRGAASTSSLRASAVFRLVKRVPSGAV